MINLLNRSETAPGLSVSALIAIIVVASYPKISVWVALRGILVRGRRRTSKQLSTSHTCKTLSFRVSDNLKVIPNLSQIILSDTCRALEFHQCLPGVVVVVVTNLAMEQNQNIHVVYAIENAKQEAFNVEFAPSGITSPVPRYQSVFCHSSRLAKTKLKGYYGVANCVRITQIVQTYLTLNEQWIK